MKPVTTPLRNILLNSDVVTAIPKVTAEWEHNRFSPMQPITVTPDQATDLEWSSIYSLESIGKPNRPRAGIAKARFSPNLKAVRYRDTPTSSRFYLSGENDPYQYWSSTQKSNATMTNSEYAFSAPVVLTLMYTSQVVANKLVVGFETSYASPKSFSVQVTADGTTWTSAAIAPSLDANGQLVLWRDSAGGWANTQRFDGPGALKGIRVTVNSMNAASSHVDVLQMGLRLEDDLSDYVESYTKNFEVGDRSLIAPVGRASANVGTVVLNNIDGRFNNENQSSNYFGLLAKRVRIKVDLSYNATPLGSADERLHELTMWTDAWGDGEETSVTVSLVDSSVILQEIPMPRVFWTDLTVGAIVWQTMDIIGLTNYTYSRSVLDSGQIVPYFFPETDKTVWETLASLAEGTQTALYFDEYDILQIKTRKALYAVGKVVDWNLDAIQNGQKQPDIVDTSKDNEIVVNKVDINYKPAKYSDYANGFPKMETVWEPTEETVTLRSSPLVKNLLTSDTSIWIRQADADFWPYTASVDIRGEVITYNGKEYSWHGTDNAVHYDVIKSLDEKTAIDAKSDPALMWSNTFTGRLIITARAVNGTVSTNHLIRPANYTGLVSSYNNSKFYPTTSTNGMNVNNGTLTLSPPVSIGPSDYFRVQPEAVVSSINTTYGYRFRYPVKQLQNNGWSVGGMVIAGDIGDTGYYLEIITTDVVENIEKRQWRHEVSLNGMPANAPAFGVASIGGDGTKGFKANIVRGQWYDVDIRHTVEAGTNNAIIAAYIDGIFAGKWSVAAAKRPLDQGKFGLHVRGMCAMEVEYAYAVNNDPSGDSFDQATFLDIVNGGYASGYIDRQWRYGPQYKTSLRGPAHSGSYWFNALQNRASYFLDEFGPVVHEMREFEIVFDDTKVPASHSYLYISNDSKAVCTNYWADPFSAKFTLVNCSRDNAILKGDDASLGENNTISQQMFVYGRTLYQTDSATVSKSDDASIRANGTVNLTIENRFVETESAANDIGQWVLDQWAAGSDEVKANVFGNPLLQLGDLVTINYPIKGMYPSTHRYWVVSIDNSFTTGLETGLVLRRARTV